MSVLVCVWKENEGAEKKKEIGESEWSENIVIGERIRGFAGEDICV